MFERPGRAFGAGPRATALLVLTVLVLSGLPRTVSAEIPHENYDIASPDIETVINLLNTSIRASEYALMDFYNESVANASQYLSMVDRVLGPAEQILSSIQNVAGSYQNLTDMLPPFVGLYGQMVSFSSMEVTFLDDRDDLVAASQHLNLSDAERLAALQIISSVNSLMDRMNGTIDQMLVFALDISIMKVNSRLVFTPNQLEPLILKLRDLLHTLDLRIRAVVNNGLIWGKNQTFLVMWIDETQLYLGENLTGGGYLYYDTVYQGDHAVRLLLDSSLLLIVTTSSEGRFTFSYTIPVVASMLGQHTVQANASTPNGTLTSDVISFVVILMPTVLTIEADKTLMSIADSMTANANLKDVNGRDIVGATVNWTLDSSTIPAITDSAGSIHHAWTSAALGFGTHSLSASYDGRLPYASNVSKVITVTVNIPTKVQLRLFSDKFAPGYYIVGNGSLSANDTQRMPHQPITIYLDATVVFNATTDAKGEFAFSISSVGVPGGTHTLRAAFLHRDIMWRYSEADVTFVLSKYTQGKYPFFPFFPGWETGPDLEITYLFFGPNAYYTWLFMLLILGVIIKTLQIRKRRIEEAAASPLEIAPLPGSVPEPETAPEAAFSIEALASGQATDEPRDPNGQIIWYYHGLLNFLRRKRRVTISDSMTHWEVARLLKALGYPKEGVERITILFERAFYSGSPMSDIDAVSMSAAMSGMMGPRGGAAGAG